MRRLPFGRIGRRHGSRPIQLSAHARHLKLPGCSTLSHHSAPSAADADAFAKVFAEVVGAAPAIACALVRLAPGPRPMRKPSWRRFCAAVAADCALLIENDGRWRRLAQMAFMSTALARISVAAIESLKPERIVGAGFLRTRDEAMTAGEMGADYVMFGEPRRGAAMTDCSRWPSGSAGGRKSSRRRASPTPTRSPPRARWLAPAPISSRSARRSGRPSPSEAAREAQALIAGVGAKVP